MNNILALMGIWDKKKPIWFEPKGREYGGYGNGWGDGCGDGEGAGWGDGYGYGWANGDGYGRGYGWGKGDGYGCKAAFTSVVKSSLFIVLLLR